MATTAIRQEVDELREYMKELSYQAMRTEMSLNRLADEMREFKDETELDRKRMNKQWGDLANRLGTLVEDIVAPSLPRVAAKLFGCDIPDFFAVRIARRRNGETREYDAILACGDVVLVNETKSRLQASHIDPLLLKLAELPRFSSLPPDETFHFEGAIELCPSLGYMQRAYRDAKDHGWSRDPIVSMQIPSTQDDSLAPPGAHVASLFCQHVNPEPDGGWDAHRDTFADLAIQTVDRHAPNFAASILGRRILSPLDLEREYGLLGGDIFHGALGLDQLFSARPLLGQADYRGAVPGLYLCGSGTHPGGGVTGLPGRNAAHAILRH